MSSHGGAVGIASTSSEVQESTIRYIEKAGEAEHILLSHEEQFPEDPNADLETQQFTVRAVVVGCLLGGVIAASKYVLPSDSKQGC